MALQFSPAEIISLFGVCFVALGIAFAFTKWIAAGAHARMTEIKRDQDRQLDHLHDEVASIRSEYAHKTDIDKSVGNIQTMINDMKGEQHRMTQRMDEFMKWIMKIQMGNKKDD